MYDFILFETLFNSVNHCKDVCLIARMLRDCGYKVAIADVFHEQEYCIVDGIPHIQIKAKCNASLVLSRAKTSYSRYLNNLRNRFLIDLYICKVIMELAPMTRNFYVGTMMIGMPFMWLWKIPKEKKVFFWGLRSYYLTYFKHHNLRYETLNSYIISKFFFSHGNVCFFVSDSIIKSEFLELGFREDRLVHRPERVIERLPDKTESNNTQKHDRYILSIGYLRPSKRVDLFIKAYNQIDNLKTKLVIAGKASPDYGYSANINELASQNTNIERIDKRLSDEEYNKLIINSNYLLICDEKQLSSVTNGTMNEALLSGKPIIAPNYDPYKTIVNKYNVGILYDIESDDAIIESIKRADIQDIEIYSDGLEKYQTIHLYENVLNKFQQDISKALS